MIKNFLIVTFLLFSTLSGRASTVSDTLLVNTFEDVERITVNLDSLVSNWYVRLALQNNPIVYGDSVGIIYPDSIYSQRLAGINSIITLPYNSIIKNHIHVYTIKQRDKFSVVLGLKDYYFPMIEDIFDSYGLPAELKYMAVIESALNPNAVSRVGATGMWQFMYSTGKAYGLTVNSIIDERRDPVKATHAAARYLKDLYKIYNDWVLVIAAYNCGPGNVNKAIRRSGNKKDYWDIYYRLPRETRGYIPQFVAAAYATTYYADHNIEPLPISFPIATDTVMLNKDIHFSQIAEVLGVSYSEIKALNPAYKTGLIPATSKAMPITLPITYVGEFIELNDSIRNYKADVYVNKKTDVDPTKSSNTPPDIKGKTKLTYIVKEGDNLGFIADWYNVGLSDLRYWNNIYGSTIRIGQKISVYVDPDKSGYYTTVNDMTFAQKQASKGKSVPTNSVKTTTTPVYDGDYEVYIVKSGDTIWDIVKMFDGVTTTDILALNNISNPQKIQVGQRLKIKKKS